MIVDSYSVNGFGGSQAGPLDAGSSLILIAYATDNNTMEVNFIFKYDKIYKKKYVKIL